MTATVLYGLLGLLASQAVVAQSGVITNDSYFYGESPPFYPSPNATGTGNWAAAYEKARALVGQMTLEEKVNLTGGSSESANGCSGTITSIPRLNFPGLCLSDAGNGLRSTDYVTSWASGWSVGASFNRDLAHQRAVGMAGEFRKKGTNIALGPVVGPLGRIAENGRNWEGFSNDPYLCGALAYETVQGMQSVGVITSLKHYIAYEQETNRVPEGDVSSVSSNLDDKTLHELYLWPFQDAVHAGSGNIMCSYNRINGSWACQNSWTLNNILKTELGFQGFVVSDWTAQHSGVASANAGLDMTMPVGSTYWGDNLVESVNNGSVSAARLDDMVTRIVAAWYQMGQDSGDYPAPGVGIPRDLTAPHEKVIGWNASFKNVTYQGALEGHVLVKNVNNTLPLQSPQLISLYGYSAKTPDSYYPGNAGWNGGAYPLAANDTWTPAYISSPFEALSVRAQNDLTGLYWDFESTNPEVDGSSDACIVDVNAFASEGWDRPNLHDDYTDSIILNVAANCANTIVIFQNAGARLVDTFIDHPNVTALIFAHVPGQDSGKALVSLLYGDENFSGKLPYSLPKNESDYSDLAGPAQPEGEFALYPQANFTEGVYIDYRAFDAKNITPRYEFGFGLSYTTFAFSGLSIAKGNASTASYPTGEILEGGQVDLWDVVATVSATVTNTGSVDGAEVAQLYVGIPGGPVRQLRGFEKPVLAAGASASVSFPLTRKDLSTWDVVAQKWLLQEGDYPLYVGSSSRDLPLTGTLTI
ncbi:family 3 glycoside hydrolase [Cryphonectria parasitica EP155]|uniref:beta-glucosidase n=1 Tax=Cryphonectria parasitica (strain ATCC 38755 / EP155) TaxID=660469 RepID=A0A9P4Y5P6_CRYP1|nr:family 3 glycoside hydrolase [Cryphonectria parasitica EP155]KAF3766961.1 family 3 glycoside hydrolase [Cryphonectria parasitica EP155]